MRLSLNLRKVVITILVVVGILYFFAEDIVILLSCESAKEGASYLFYKDFGFFECYAWRK